MNQDFLHSVEGWGPYINSYRNFTEQCYWDTPHEEQYWTYNYTGLEARHRDTRLLRAVRIEDDVSVSFLLRLHANVNLFDLNGKTPLILAARNGILVYVKALLDVAGVCLNNVNMSTQPHDGSNFDDDDGFTALLYACRNLGKQESSHSGVSERIVQLLLSADVDPNIGTRSDSCLRFAILNKCWDIFWALIDKGAVNCSGEGTGFLSQSTSLYIASYCGNLEVLRKVVELSPVDEVATSEKCNRYFHNACSSGHLPSAIFIFDTLGADLSEAIDIDVLYGFPFVDCTALYNASARGYADMVEYLISKKANVNFANSWDYDESDTFFKELNIVDEFCTRTALMAACNNGHVDVVKLLLDANADLNLFDRNMKTALDLARDSGHGIVAAMLVSKEDLLVSEGAERHRWQGPRKR